MFLYLMMWMEVEDYLSCYKGIFILIGLMEQYGFIGFFGIDVLCLEIIVNYVVVEDFNIIIGLMFNVGCVQYYMVFLGFMILCLFMMIVVFIDWIIFFICYGFEKIYFFNGYGGNVLMVKVVFLEVYVECSFVVFGLNGFQVWCYL